MKFIFGFFVGLLTGALLVLAPILSSLATAIGVLALTNKMKETEEEATQTTEETLDT